jgi:hypothetical protein
MLDVLLYPEELERNIAVHTTLMILRRFETHGSLAKAFTQSTAHLETERYQRYTKTLNRIEPRFTVLLEGAGDIGEVRDTLRRATQVIGGWAPLPAHSDR